MLKDSAARLQETSLFPSSASKSSTSKFSRVPGYPVLAKIQGPYEHEYDVTLGTGRNGGLLPLGSNVGNIRRSV
jgi:hypothetical protein